MPEIQPGCSAARRVDGARRTEARRDGGRFAAAGFSGKSVSGASAGGASFARTFARAAFGVADGVRAAFFGVAFCAVFALRSACFIAC